MQNKEKFTFYIDRKATIWVREIHHIFSESEEKATKSMIESLDEDLCYNTFVSQEYQLETDENMPVELNGGQPTIYLMNHKHEEIKNNLNP